MGETRGNQELAEDDQLGPFQVAEVVEEPESGSPSRWLDQLRTRRLPVGLGVVVGVVMAGAVIGSVSNSETASEIGSILLPEAWSASAGVDSASGGEQTGGSRSSFAQLFFGDGDEAETEAATDVAATDSPDSDEDTGEAGDSVDVEDDADGDDVDADNPDDQVAER